jgi:Negative regulator of sigma F
MMPSPALKERVLSAARAQPARTRAQGRLRAIVVYAAALATAFAAFEAWGGLEHSAGRPFAYTLSIALGAGVIAALATRFSMWRGNSIAGLPARALLAVVLAAPIATLVWTSAWHGSYFEPFTRVGYRCLAQSLTTGGALLLVTLSLRKRTHPTNPVVVGAAMGAVAAAWSDIFVVLWCPLTNVPHAMVGHVLPILVLSGIGALLGRWFLAPVAR